MNIKKELFFFDKLAVGNVFWLPNGILVKNKLINLLRKIREDNNFIEIETPTIFNGNLWKKTKHLDFFSENMFLFGDLKQKNKNSILGFKPMSCPGAALLFNFISNKSYKILPYRTFEFGRIFRKELSGTLNGLKRLMYMTQDDSHIFISEEHMIDEIDLLVKKIILLYKKFDLSFKVYLSNKPIKYIGENEQWEGAIMILKKVLNNNNLNYVVSKDGAFYGPKIDFCILDKQKEWQCGTIQLDFYLCKNLNVYYKNKLNKRCFPIVIHNALLGTIERFLGVLLDIKKKLPFFLSPYAINIILSNEKYKKNNKNLKLKNNIIKFLELKNISYCITNNEDNINKYNFIINILENDKICIVNCDNKSKILGNYIQCMNFLDKLE